MADKDLTKTQVRRGHTARPPKKTKKQLKELGEDGEEGDTGDWNTGGDLTGACVSVSDSPKSL